MIRNVFGSLLALLGAAAAVYSPFLVWYDGRPGRDYRVADLFEGITGVGAGVFTSLLLPLLFAALVTLVGVAVRSRLLVALAGVVVLGLTILWMVRQGQAAGSIGLRGDGTGLSVGVVYAFGGGAVLLLAALVMSGRRRRGRPARRGSRDDTRDDWRGEAPGMAPAGQQYGPQYGQQYGYEPQPYQPQQHPHDPYQADPYQQGPYQQDPYQPQEPYQDPYRQGPYRQDPYEQGSYQPDPRQQDPSFHDGDTQSFNTDELWGDNNRPPDGPPPR